MKKLYDYSWQVSEEQYRSYPAIHYSLLSAYDKRGFDALYEQQESTPALNFGSLVDTLVTKKDEFNDMYYITTKPLTDRELTICKYFLDGYGISYWEDIPTKTHEEVYEHFPSNWKNDTKNKYITEILEKYYDNYVMYHDKIWVSEEDYLLASSCANKLIDKLNNKYGSISNAPFYYQYKFKTELNGIEYKCMFDCLVVDYNNKKIYPIDIKTTGKPEYDFARSFLYYKYYHQARLYVRILKNVLKDTDYKDFTIEPMEFLVINKDKQKPLFFKFKQSFDEGTLQLGVEIAKDPEDIGKEINEILTNKLELPLGISENESNDITKIIEDNENKD